MVNTIRSIQKEWPVLFGLFMGLYFITLNVTGIEFTHFPGDMGDARFNIYLLEHAHKFLMGGGGSFWDAPFMFPEERVITYSDNLLGSAPVYSIFRILGLDTHTSFQWWYVVVTALNYLCCYLFLRSLFKNRYAAVLGAMVFTFSMALQAMMGHPQTFPRFAVPLALWSCISFSHNFRPRFLLAVGIFVVWQFYCGVYLGFMLLIPVAVVLFLAVLLNWKKMAESCSDPRWVVQVGTFLLISGSLLLPLALPYMDRADEMGYVPYEKALQKVATIKSYFFNQPGSLLWDRLSDTASEYSEPWSHQIFVGGIAMLSFLIWSLIVMGNWLCRGYIGYSSVTKQQTILWVAGLTTAILFMRFPGFSPYMLIHELPGFGSMRALQRIINVELVFFAAATAFMFSMVRKKRTRMADLAFIVSVCFLTADNYYFEDSVQRMEKAPALARIEALEKLMEHASENGIVSYEPRNMYAPVHVYQIDAMLASQGLDLKTVNGYSGTSPKGYSSYWRAPNEKNRKEWFRVVGFEEGKVYVVE